MKKTSTLLLMLLMAVTGLRAQDTLAYENFNVDNTANWPTFTGGFDTTWVSFDNDNNTDANGRPGNWFWNDIAFGTNDTTGCIFSSSWFSTVATASNYFVTPPIQIVDANANLSWRAAPRQTPRYLDGYKVLVSTSDNFPTSFTDTIYIAGEYISGSNAGFDFSAYIFSPGFLHGSDSTYVEFDTDSSAFIGLLRPFSASLAQYSGQTIYIAFLHDATDDNLMAVDDILVTGTAAQSLEENVLNGATLFPNPASTHCTLSYNSSVAGNAHFGIYDLSGKLVKSDTRYLSGFGQQIQLPVSDLAAGNYFLIVNNGKGTTRLPLIVTK